VYNKFLCNKLNINELGALTRHTNRTSKIHLICLIFHIIEFYLNIKPISQKLLKVVHI